MSVRECPPGQQHRKEAGMAREELSCEAAPVTTSADPEASSAAKRALRDFPPGPGWLGLCFPYSSCQSLDGDGRAGHGLGQGGCAEGQSLQGLTAADCPSHWDNTPFSGGRSRQGISKSRALVDYYVYFHTVALAFSFTSKSRLTFSGCSDSWAPSSLLSLLLLLLFLRIS